MLTILPLNEKVKKKIQKYSLGKKFEKQINYLKINPRHPSLNVELLEPKIYGIHSFRIDLKFRALFVFNDDLNAVEILNITAHYQN